jgi:hypothetical protein
MGILDKLMFWKKKDEFSSDIGNFGADPSMGQAPNLGMNVPEYGQDLGLPNQGYNEPQFGQQLPASQFGQAPSMFQGYQQPAKPAFDVNKDMEVISAKLDSLRAYLDSINQRLANIERIAMNEEEKKRGW